MSQLETQPPKQALEFDAISKLLAGLPRHAIPAEFVVGEVDALAPIASLLEDHFPKGDEQLMLCDGLGAMGLDATWIALELGKRVRNGETPQQATAWLERLLGIEEAGGTAVMALWGVDVSEPIALTDTLCLTPLAALPPTAAQKLMEGRIAGRDVFRPSPISQVPTTALSLRTSFAPIVRSRAFGAVAASVGNTLDLARLAVSLIGPSSPMFAGAWFIFDSPDIQCIHHSSLHGTLHEIIPLGFTPNVRIEPTGGLDVVGRYLKLDSKLRDRLRLSLDRLNFAVRRHRPIEQALELGIALETLLTDKNPGEHTFKLGLRAGLLAPGGEEQRVRRRAVISALYRLRSAASHGGQLEDDVKLWTGERVKPTEFMKEALAAVAETIRAVVNRGAFPDWYRLELERAESPLEASAAPMTHA